MKISVHVTVMIWLPEIATCAMHSVRVTSKWPPAEEPTGPSSYNKLYAAPLKRALRYHEVSLQVKDVPEEVSSVIDMERARALSLVNDILIQLQGRSSQVLRMAAESISKLAFEDKVKKCKATKTIKCHKEMYEEMTTSESFIKVKDQRAHLGSIKSIWQATKASLQSQPHLHVDMTVLAIRREDEKEDASTIQYVVDAMMVQACTKPLDKKKKDSSTRSELLEAARARAVKLGLPEPSIFVKQLIACME